MPVSARERMFAAMRVIGEWVEGQRRQERIHIPPWGTIGLGGSDFDYLLKATVGEAYLRVLRRGGNPQEAHASAIEEGNYCVGVWNDKTHKTRAHVTGAYELKRWEKAGEAAADGVHLHFLSLCARR